MKSARRILEPSALQLVEEAVHMVRGAPASTLVIYYAGAVPFVLALLFFWAHATWFAPSGEQVAWGALGLVALFATMKAAQAEFCARLMAARLGAPAAAGSWARFWRVMVSQMRLQPWALLVSVIASPLTVPLGWIYAYAQNLVVIGDDERLHDDAVAQAKLWPGQNHFGLLLISLLSLGVWVNLAVAFFMVPWLANKLLGIENVFGFSGWWFFNTTFVASVTALTWLAVDPLVKAFYVLRVFHGRARRTGEDVRVELQLARRSSAARLGRVLAMIALTFLFCRAPIHAREALPPSPANRPTTVVQPAQLDRAIEGVLAGPEFRWRLRPMPAKADRASEGPIKRFVRQGVELVGEIIRSIGRGVKSIIDWFERHFTSGRGSASSATGGGEAALNVLRLVLYLFIAIAVVLILWVIWLMVRKTRKGATPVVTAQAVAMAAPDLRDENVQAAQLPVDGWLALARQQAERGEWRLAWRALYLATLARLAAEGLISLAKFKTNLDYEREVRRRALSRADIAARFATRRRGFEDVWYGCVLPAESEVRAWMTELERPPTG